MANINNRQQDLNALKPYLKQFMDGCKTTGDILARFPDSNEKRKLYNIDPFLKELSQIVAQGAKYLEGINQ